MTDHMISAWDIGQTLPPEVFATLKPLFQSLLLEIGRRIAEAVPVESSKARTAGLH